MISISNKSLTVLALASLMGMQVQAAGNGKDGVSVYKAGLALAAGAGVIWTGSTIQSDFNSVIKEIREGKTSRSACFKEDAANLAKTLCTAAATTYVGCHVADIKNPADMVAAVVCHGGLIGAGFLMLKHAFNNPTLRVREAVIFALVTGFGRTQLEKYGLALKIGA